MSMEQPVPHPVFLDRTGHPHYRWKDSLVPPSTADLYVGIKRLTDAELAAEFHCARGEYAEASAHPSGTYWTPLGVDEDATADTAMKRAIVALRFATLPHYDRADQ